MGSPKNKDKVNKHQTLYLFKCLRHLHFSISLDCLGIFRYILCKNICYVINSFKSNDNFTFWLLSFYGWIMPLFYQAIYFYGDCEIYWKLKKLYYCTLNTIVVVIALLCGMMLKCWTNISVLLCCCFDKSFCTVLYYNISWTRVLFLTLMASVLHWNLLNCWIDFNCILE